MVKEKMGLRGISVEGEEDGAGCVMMIKGYDYGDGW